MNEGGAARIILRESRKAFFFVYLLVAVIVAALIFISLKGYSVPGLGWILALGMIASGLIAPEITRHLNYCEVTEKKVVVWSGLLQRKHESFYIITITDVVYHQNIWQKVLNYGPIIVRTFSHVGTEIPLGKIDRPKKTVAKMVEMFDKEMPGGSND